MAEYLIIVDDRKSALGIAARNRFENSDSKIIYANDFQHPRGLLVEIDSFKARCVLFTWRQALLDISATISEDELTTLRRKFPIGVLIPDHLGASEFFGNMDSEVIELSDFYLVTSKTLFEFYSLINSNFPPQGILHDVPNSILIREVRNKAFKRNLKKAIWVGNSEWGKRQGYIDHKGLKEVILPLKGICASHGNCFEIEIIDTKDIYLSQEDLFVKMSESKFVLQSSESEGTGLPMLEGMGLGCIPITTNVGVAPEILNGTFRKNIVERNALDFHNTLHRLDSESEFTPDHTINRYEEYVRYLLTENLVPKFRVRKKSVIEISFIRRLRIYVFWFYRNKRSRR